MVRIHAEPVGPDKALVNRDELRKLIQVSGKVEEVELLEGADDLSTAGLERIAA